MKQLILCERPFMLYKAILKTFHSEDEIDIVLSNHMQGMENMYQPLVKSRLFHKVFFYDDVFYQDYIKQESLADYTAFPNILWAWPMKLRRYFKYQKKARQEAMPRGLRFYDYDEILANDGVSAMNFKLYEQKVPHVVSEHARGNFSSKPFLYMLAVYLTMVLDRLGMIPAYSGCSKYVKEIEVDSSQKLVGYIRKKKIRECPVQSLEERLTAEEKDKIYRLYAQGYGLPEEYEKEVNLLLTGPLVSDGGAKNEKEQLRLYSDVVAKNCDSHQMLLIKPHPRDMADYSRVFPDAYVVDRSIAAEVLGFCSSLHIDKAITIGSSSIASFKKARQVLVLNDAARDRYMEA